MINEYWLMVKKQMDAPQGAERAERGSQNIPAKCIVEWTTDEIVYVWPVVPSFETLCLVCKNFKLKSFQTCKSMAPHGLECLFSPVPEAVLSQDFDDFRIDGEYLSECGYYFSFADFKKQNEYSDDDFLFYRIGAFPSIREARIALKFALQAMSQC